MKDLQQIIEVLQEHSDEEHSRDQYNPSWCDSCDKEALTEGSNEICLTCGTLTRGALDSGQWLELQRHDELLIQLQAVQGQWEAERQQRTQEYANLNDLADRLSRDSMMQIREYNALMRGVREAIKVLNVVGKWPGMDGCLEHLMGAINQQGLRTAPPLIGTAKAIDLFPELREALTGKPIISYATMPEMTPARREMLILVTINRAAMELCEAHADLLNVERILRPLWAHAHAAADGTLPKETPSLTRVAKWAAEYIMGFWPGDKDESAHVIGTARALVLCVGCGKPIEGHKRCVNCDRCITDCCCP